MVIISKVGISPYEADVVGNNNVVGLGWVGGYKVTKPKVAMCCDVLWLC